MSTVRKRASGEQVRDKVMLAVAFIVFGGLALLAASVPDFLELLCFFVVVSLFCADSNILSTSCNSSLAQDIFGWAVVLVFGALFALWLRALYRAWKRLTSAG